MTIYAYHRFSTGAAIPKEDRYRRSERDFVADLQKIRPDDEIHIDDASISAYEIAVPALRRAMKRAVFFVPVANVGKPFFMTWDQIREVAKVHEIGNHSYEHIDLCTISLDAAAKNIRAAQLILEKEIGYAPKLFVPPYEACNQAIADCVLREGLHLVTGRVTVYNNTTLHADGPQVSDAAYWDSIYSGKIQAEKAQSHKNGFDRFSVVVGLIKDVPDVTSILDVASGYGSMALAMKAAFPGIDVVAVDHSHEAMKHSKFRPYLVESCYALSAGYKSVDLLVCTQGMEFFEDEDRFLNEAARVAHRAILTIPDGKDQGCSQVREHSIETFCRLLERHGKVEILRKVGPMLMAQIRF